MAEASEALGFDVARMAFEGDEETLRVTENTQPCILAVSVAIYAALDGLGVKAGMAAGLSLGEYGALVAAGALDFRDAVSLVRRRGRYMQEAVPVGEGMMAAIIGLEDGAVEDICSRAGGHGLVSPANYNCPGQVAISGEVKAVEWAMEEARRVGAKKVAALQVSAPFHCAMLRRAGDRLAADLGGVPIGAMRMPVVSNVTGEAYGDLGDVRGLLARQVYSPVRWADCVRAMVGAGVDAFVEVGPGTVLSGFIKRISKDSAVHSAADCESLERAAAALG